MSAENIKSFFHQWCDKQGITPQFDVRTVGKFFVRSQRISSYLLTIEVYFSLHWVFINCSGRKQAPRFLCEVRVQGHAYVGVGNSTTKKESQFNAARDFVQFLVRQGIIQEREVPSEVTNILHLTYKFHAVSHSAISYIYTG